MPSQVENGGELLSSFAFPYSTFVILLEVFQFPIANFLSNFFNYIVLSLPNIYYESVLCICTAKWLVTIVLIELIIKCQITCLSINELSHELHPIFGFKTFDWWAAVLLFIVVILRKTIRPFTAFLTPTVAFLFT
jgi:hypothetical protein